MVALALALALGMAAAAQAAEVNSGQFGFYVGAWLPAPTGTVQSGTASVDVVADMGLSTTVAPVAGIKYYFSQSRVLSLGYYGVSSTGFNTLGKTFVFNNVNYMINDSVNSRAQLSSLDLLYTAPFSLGPIDTSTNATLNYVLGAKALSASINLDNVTRGTTSGFSSSAVIPEIGLSASGNINPTLGVHAQGLWMAGRANNITGYMIDLNAGVDYDWNPNWSASLDYHWLGLHGESVDASNIRADVQYGGPSLTLNYRP